MRIAVPRETAPGERRVALVPESCKKLIITYDGEVKHARTRDALQKAEAHAETVA
jgi:alanine dehydrogenase